MPFKGIIHASLSQEGETNELWLLGVVSAFYYDHRAFHRDGSVHEICEALDVAWKDIHQWVGFPPVYNAGDVYNFGVLRRCFVDVWAETNRESDLDAELVALVKDHLVRFYHNIPQTRTPNYKFARAIRLKLWDGELDEILSGEYGVNPGANNIWGVNNLRMLREQLSPLE